MSSTNYTVRRDAARATYEHAIILNYVSTQATHRIRQEQPRLAGAALSADRWQREGDSSRGL